MDMGIPRTRCLGFLIYGARGCEDMFERLRLVESVNMKNQIIKTYCYEEAAVEETIPWIFGIIRVVGIQENGPLVSGYLKLAI